MNLRDIIYFANLYETLTSDHVEHLYNQEALFSGMPYQRNVCKFIDILEICIKLEDKKVYGEQIQNLIRLFVEVDKRLKAITPERERENDLIS